MSRETLVITLMGCDKPGIVAGIAEWVSQCGGNWLESRLLNLGGQFAGALRVDVSRERRRALQEKLEGLRESGLRIDWVVEQAADAPAPRRLTTLSLSGQDQPGIVHRVFSILGRHKINVEELKTGIRGAPWSGHALFEAEARLSVPEAVEIEVVRQDLESLSHDLLVEIGISG